MLVWQAHCRSTGRYESVRRQGAFENLNSSLPPSGIVGMVGPNGVGKATLFKLTTGFEQPDGRSFKVGKTVEPACIEKFCDLLRDKKTILEVISDAQEIKIVTHSEQLRLLRAMWMYQGNPTEKGLAFCPTANATGRCSCRCWRAARSSSFSTNQRSTSIKKMRFLRSSKILETLLAARC